MEMSCRRPGKAWSMPALAAPAVAGEQVARPVKPCNAPTTKFSVGRGHRGDIIEPGSFTAEVDGDVIIRPDGAREWKYVFQRVPARMGRRNEMQSRSALPLQPSNVSGLEVLANGVLGGGVDSYRNQLAKNKAYSKTPSHILTYFQGLMSLLVTG
jgi:hypothetical protein